MIKIKENLKKFISILKILELLNEDVTLNFKENEIAIRISDKSSVTLLLLNINKSFFDEYKVEKGIYSINISNFAKIVKKMGKKELEMEIKPECILLKNKSDEFKIKYYTVPNDERETPEPLFTNIWEINSNDFFNSVSDLSVFNVVGCFSSKDNICINVKSSGIEGKTIINSKKIKGEECECYYDLTYLNILSGIKEIYDSITFKFGRDCPCSIEGNNEDINLVWFLAERINNDE